MKTRQELILEFMLAMSPRFFDLDDDDQINAAEIRQAAALLADTYLEILL